MGQATREVLHRPFEPAGITVRVVLAATCPVSGAAGLPRCKWISERLSVGESIQGVCFHENLSPFIEKLATQ